MSYDKSERSTIKEYASRYGVKVTIYIKFKILLLKKLALFSYLVLLFLNKNMIHFLLTFKILWNNFSLKLGNWDHRKNTK